MNRARRGRKQLWVVKAGSAILVDGGPLLVRAWMQQTSTLQEQFNVSVIWVTSGAIASAQARLRKSWNKLPEKQALSSIGQPIVMDTYNLALQSIGMMGSQVLLTYDDIGHRKRSMNLKNTLATLLSWNVVPILNENDSVATEEIQFGDNDTLSAKVARLMKADRLVILTNVDGLFDKNPQTDPDAKLIHHVPRITPSILAQVDPCSMSSKGRGGMYSKLKAAALAQGGKIETWVLKGDTPNALLKVARNETIGTRIGR